MIKTAKTIQPGDIFRAEYGDYDNICEFVFISCRECTPNCTETTVRYPRGKTVFNIYEFRHIDKVTYDVVGKEVI